MAVFTNLGFLLVRARVKSNACMYYPSPDVLRYIDDSESKASRLGCLVNIEYFAHAQPQLNSTTNILHRVVWLDH